MMMGVSDSLRQLRQYQLINPPIVRAMVNDGVLYMPKWEYLWSASRSTLNLSLED